MNRKEYMDCLALQLLSLSPEEREAALRYYSEYFDDAGTENEQKVIEELGAPTQLAESIIRESGILQPGLPGTDKAEAEQPKAGWTPEHGWTSGQGGTDGTGFGTQSAGEARTQSGTSGEGGGFTPGYAPGTAPRQEGMPVWAIVLIAVFTAPFWLPILGTLFGAAAAVAGAFVAMVVAAGALALAGVVMAGVGIAMLFSVPVVGLVFFGGGLILLGIGLLGLLLGIWLCGSVLPSFFRWIVRICKKPFHSREASV